MNTMVFRKFWILMALVLVSFSLSAQDDKKEIMKVIASVFEGMATNNGQMIRDAFTTDAQSFTVLVDKHGMVQKKAGSIEKFAQAVDRDKEPRWFEPIWDEKVNIDGAFASVWVDYAFYLGKEFHHCGVDAFHLVNNESGWKIFHLVDTRRIEDCEIPNEIRKEYGG